MYLVRKITRAKWDRTARFADGEIPADAVTADLRTTDNALSLWASADGGGDPLNDAVLALVAGADRVDKVDVVWIERANFDEAGVELDETDGRTPVTDLVDRHVDAVRLDLVRLGRFAEQVVDALGAEQHKRLTKKRVAQLIATAVDAGRVPLADLDEKVQVEVSKYVEQSG
jgi:hypothetical protein